MINIMDPEGRLNDEVPEAYRGLDRFDARKAVLRDLEAQGLIEKIEPIRHMVPYSQRSETPVEPILSDQWYADAKTLAQPAIEAVEQGRTRFVPEQWQNTYFEWMRNIQPWCISRQLWWGHQIPAWYGPDGTIFVAMDEAEAAAQAAAHYGETVAADPRRGRARHLVLLGAVAVLDARLAGAHARAGALLPDQRAGDRLRHHLLLGRADDDDGPALHGRGAVPRRLHPRPGARRARPEDEQEQGQRRRPARADRPVRRRCAALHDPRQHRAGPRHPVRRRPRAGLPQFLHQAVERGAVLRAAADASSTRPSIRGRAGRSSIAGRSASSPRRPSGPAPASRTIASTRRRARSTASPGTSSATGTSSSPSRCSPAATRKPGRRPAPAPPGSWRSCCTCCIR